MSLKSKSKLTFIPAPLPSSHVVSDFSPCGESTGQPFVLPVTLTGHIRSYWNEIDWNCDPLWENAHLDVYRERFNHVSGCVPQLRFLYLSCLLWFDSSVLYSIEFTVPCHCLQIPLSCSIQKHQQNFHLETELDAKNLKCMNVCTVHSTVANVCLDM